MDAWGYCAHLRANKLNHQPFCLSGFATVEILGGLLRARLGHWTAIDGLIRPLVCAEIAIVYIAVKLFCCCPGCYRGASARLGSHGSLLMNDWLVAGLAMAPVVSIFSLLNVDRC